MKKKEEVIEYWPRMANLIVEQVEENYVASDFFFLLLYIFAEISTIITNNKIRELMSHRQEKENSYKLLKKQRAIE